LHKNLRQLPPEGGRLGADLIKKKIWKEVDEFWGAAWKINPPYLKTVVTE